MTKSKAKTIEIFLPDGDPKSIKVASITSRNVEATYIPRPKLDEAKKRENLSSVGIYLLVGVSEEHSKPELYIGEAENCLARLSQHNASKDFWQYVIVVTSKTNQFTKTHGKFLEWLSYDAAKQANRSLLMNANTPTKPYVSESMEADLYDSFETALTLISTLGLQAFQQARASNTDTAPDADQQFFITRKGVQGAGLYSDEGFVVLAGSHFNLSVTPSLSPAVIKKREQLINDNILQKRDAHYELTEDVIFNSPSYAGACVTGRSTNGWTAWKLSNGSTLSDVYRSN